jgi:hypothetical protein
VEAAFECDGAYLAKKATSMGSAHFFETEKVRNKTNNNNNNIHTYCISVSFINHIHPVPPSLLVFFFKASSSSSN